MFVDYCKIEVKAGDGGDGGISFRREKYISKGGPDGGDGGDGGSIILKVNQTVNSLHIFRKSRIFIAQNGSKGGTKNCHGRNGENIIIDVPKGTIIYDEITNELLCDLNENNQEFMIVKGGKGGRGNAAFKNAKNRIPRIAEHGELGEKKKIILELKLIADIGLIGLPNAGKSTLLSVISNAKPKINNYPFTTLNPCLGVVNYKNNSFIVADIPGIIEGAHQGKGLGLKFLRHVERCKVIVHLISMENDKKELFNNYKIINNEIKKYDKKILKRQIIIIASKMDKNDSQNKKKILEKKIKKKIIGICAIKNLGINDFLDKCLQKINCSDNNIEIKIKEKIYDARLEKNNNNFFISHPKKNEWHVESNKIMHYFSLNNDDNIQKILLYLDKLGINNELKKKGIKKGDIVYINDFVFEYVEK